MTRDKENSEFREFDVLPPEIWRQHEGKYIIYSEDEKRVIGVGDTEEEALAQAEASGVGGLWHSHHAARWGEFYFGGFEFVSVRQTAFLTGLV